MPRSSYVSQVEPGVTSLMEELLCMFCLQFRFVFCVIFVAKAKQNISQLRMLEVCDSRPMQATFLETPRWERR